jgi:hypothetical protein
MKFLATLDRKYVFATIGILLLLFMAYFPPPILTETQRATIGDNLLLSIMGLIGIAVGGDAIIGYAKNRDAPSVTRPTPSGVQVYTGDNATGPVTTNPPPQTGPTRIDTTRKP